MGRSSTPGATGARQGSITAGFQSSALLPFREVVSTRLAALEECLASEHSCRLKSLEDSIRQLRAENSRLTQDGGARRSKTSSSVSSGREGASERSGSKREGSSDRDSSKRKSSKSRVRTVTGDVSAVSPDPVSAPASAPTSEYPSEDARVNMVLALPNATLVLPADAAEASETSSRKDSIPSEFPSSDEDDDDEDDLGHEVLDIWLSAARSSINGSSSQLYSALSGYELDMEDFVMESEGQFATAISFVGRFVFQPNSVPCVMWDLMCLALVCHDVIAVPLECFDYIRSYWILPQVVARWVSCIVWTLDMLVCCFRGFVDKHGTLECRIDRITRRYSISWLWFDLCILTCSWIELCEPGGRKIFGVGSWLRRMSWLRALRMFRLRHTLDMMEVPKWHIQSETFTLFLGIFKCTLGIALLVHLLACFWYGVGSPIGGSADAWVRGFEEANDTAPSFGARYAWSFQWALLQFTGLGLQVEPQLENTSEATFTNVVVLLSFVISLSFGSVITTSMTRFTILQESQMRQFNTLRRYLYDNGISGKLASRVTQNAKHSFAERKRNTPEGDVELLAFISEPLRMELHFELHSAAFERHPFFIHFAPTTPVVMRQLCHTAVATMPLSSGDVAFCEGEVPTQPRMFFIVQGAMHYLQCAAVPFMVSDTDSISEAVLWTQWTHRGTLRATIDSHLCTLDARTFQKVVSQCKSPDHIFTPEIYAREFVGYMNSSTPSALRDITCVDKLRAFGARAFGAREKFEKSASRMTFGSRMSRASNGSSASISSKKEKKKSRVSKNSNASGASLQVPRDPRASAEHAGHGHRVSFDRENIAATKNHAQAHAAERKFHSLVMKDDHA